MHKTISTKIDMISSTKYMMCLNYKGRSPYNGKLSDFSFYIDSQISVHRKLKKNQLII
jgi:hypothetical protein